MVLRAEHKARRRMRGWLPNVRPRAPSRLGKHCHIPLSQSSMLAWPMLNNPPHFTYSQGCQVQPSLGFSYLQRAAESVVGELCRFSPGALPSLAAQGAARTAVVLALYEMGTSFRFGWGTAKDKKMAVEYFTMAAELGDVDAQGDLAFCYANGKGCKKDMKKAARVGPTGAGRVSRVGAVVL